MKKVSAKDWVQSGQYLELIQVYEKRTNEWSSIERSWLVGALSFLGRLEEVEDSLRQIDSPSEAYERGRFYYILLLIRLSKYEQAQVELDAIERKKTKTFFNYQSLGFSCYFSGDLEKASLYGKEALQSTDDEYETFLAMDLLGHTLVQRGQFHQGLDYLSKAREHALKKKLLGQAEASRVAILGYKAEFGFELNETRQLMDEFILNPTTQDFYSLSSLLLDRARSFLIDGQIEAAEKLAQKAALAIYRSRNQRQSLLLNLLRARILALRGDYLGAFPLVDTVIKLCHPKYDHQFKLKALGLKSELFSDLEDHPWTIDLGIKDLDLARAEVDGEILGLTKNFPRYVSVRLLQRKIPDKIAINDASIDQYSDDIGESLDRIEKIANLKKGQQSAELILFQELIQKGLCGLITRLPSLKSLRRYLIFDWLTSGGIVIVQESEVYIQQEGFSPLLKKLLWLLSQEAQSKVQLVSNLYGYQYDPLIHDPLVYSLLSRLRKLLGPFSQLLVVDEEGYRFDAKTVFIRREKRQIEQSSLPQTIEPETEAGEYTVLNSRQLDLLDEFQSGLRKVITPGSYRELFSVSRMTATRDLGELCDKGYLVAFGKARGISYRRART